MSSISISNPPGFLNMQNYRSAVSRDNGPSKIQRFAARLLLPQGLMKKHKGTASDIQYLCEATEFPGRGFMNIDTRYYGPNFKVPYQTTYEDLNLTLLVRDKFLERELFDDWMELINPTNTYDFNYKEQYEAKIELYQMADAAGTDGSTVPAQYKFSFLQAWPILVNPQPVNWAEDNFHRLTVAFTYRRWVREGIDKPTTTTTYLNGNFDAEPIFANPIRA